MRHLFAMAAFVLAAPFLAASPAPAAGKTGIVAAENFYGDVARQIGGEHVTVTSILSNPEQDPHLFETSPSAGRAVADAGIVVFNGAGYDPWMESLLAAARRPGRVEISAAELAGYRDGDNPHLWFAPATLPAVAERLAAALQERDPANAAAFRANLKAFRAAMAKVDAAVARVRDAHAGAGVTATEPVFGYMAEALGLVMLNEDFQTAIMNDAEPSPSAVAAFEKSLADGSARVLFYNSQVTDAATERLLDIARRNKVAVVGVTETLPEGRSVQAWFEETIGAVEKALEQRAF